MTEFTRRQFGIGAAALSLLTPFAARAQQDPLWFVDPELRPVARQLQEYAKTFPGFSAATLPTVRKREPAWAGKLLADVPYSTRKIPVSAGDPDVAITIINARPGAKRGGILHIHGGGFVAGTVAERLRDLQELARTLDCAIVSVEYRLAPETTYAGSTADNYTALRWLHAHADELGVDRAKIAVMGESAGGGHAALLAIRARDRGEVPVALQVLIYPMLDDRTGTTRQVPPHIGTLLWTASSNRFGWQSFLGQAPGGKSAPAGAVPARVTNLKGLPPTFIASGGIDLFVREDIDYAKRLTEAGVATELLVVPGAFHGFDLLAPQSKAGQQFTGAKIAALRRAFAD